MNNQRAKAQSEKIKLLREQVDDLMEKQGKQTTTTTESKPIEIPKGSDINMN